jgi:predicted phosphodiesterase
MAKTLGDFKTKHDPRTIIARLEADLREAKGELGIQSAISDILGASLHAFAEVPALPWTTKKGEADAPGIPTLFLSDIHAGEVVDSGQVNGVNKYDMELCASRMHHTIQTAIHLCHILDPQMRYPGIVIPLGGDMVSGDIHDELVATNELPTIPTVLDLYELLVSVLSLAADTFKQVFVPCVSGNHGRNTKRIWAKNRNATSFDWLLYKMLAQRFAKDTRVSFYIPDGSDGLYRIYNTRYLLTHGDQFKAGDSIIGPIGPIFRGTQKKLARNQAVNQDFDLAIMGHWHQYIHTERIIVNGSMKGYDEYASQGNFGFEPPRQAMWITHPKYGVTWRMPVLCETPKSAPKADWVSVLK